MPCIRCGGDYKIEKHHIIHRVRGGNNDKDNLVDLCRHCHKYQHAKEKVLDVIIYWANELRNINNSKELAYIRPRLDLAIKRLDTIEQENTPLMIISRGYYPYWNNKELHLVKKR